MNENNLPVKIHLGRPLKYTPEELAKEFEEYVAWCETHPIKVETRTDYANGFSHTTDSKPRLVSIDGFRLWLGCSDTWWTNIEKSKQGALFLRVKEEIRKYCEAYQKEMAAAGVFNANIISRLLGLADKQQVEANVDYKFNFGEEQNK